MKFKTGQNRGGHTEVLCTGVLSSACLTAATGRHTFVLLLNDSLGFDFALSLKLNSFLLHTAKGPFCTAFSTGRIKTSLFLKLIFSFITFLCVFSSPFKLRIYRFHRNKILSLGLSHLISGSRSDLPSCSDDNWTLPLQYCCQQVWLFVLSRA